MSRWAAAILLLSAATRITAVDQMSIIVTPEEASHTRPMIMIESVRGEGDPAPTQEDLAAQVNQGDAWTCSGNPPKCDRMTTDAKGVMFYGPDEIYDHRGMGTRWLGGPTLTMENIWENDRNAIGKANRQPTANMTVTEGDSPRLKSGLHKNGKPIRVQWAFNKTPLYDHTNGLPDDGDRNHHTMFWIGELFDMILENVTAKDTGRYTAIYRLRGTEPMLETEIDLKVQYLPTPTMFSGDGQPSKLQLAIGQNETTATCLATKGEPPATMTWFKDGQQLNNSMIVDKSDHRRTIQTIRVLREDEGALITCKIGSTFTEKEKTVTRKVKCEKEKHKIPTPLVGASKSRAEDTILRPVAVALLSCTAVLGLALCITGAVALKKRRDAQYALEDMETEQETPPARAGHPNV